MKKIKELEDEDVVRISKDCGFEVIEIKHFEGDTIYYLKEEDSNAD